jgi:hypothetical protein
MVFGWAKLSKKYSTLDFLHQWKLDCPVFDPSPVNDLLGALMKMLVTLFHLSAAFSQAAMQILHLTSCSFKTISTASRWTSLTDSTNRCKLAAVRIQGNCSKLYSMSQAAQHNVRSLCLTAKVINQR